MEQLHPTQSVYHDILHEDRQRALRGCDERSYAFLCRRRLETGTRGRRARIRDTLAKALRVVQRRGRTEQIHESLPANDPASLSPHDEPVICIDLGNPLAGTSTPKSSADHRSDPDSAHHGKL
jgi:hypothetical protein